MKICNSKLDESVNNVARPSLCKLNLLTPSWSFWILKVTCVNTSFKYLIDEMSSSISLELIYIEIYWNYWNYYYFLRSLSSSLVQVEKKSYKTHIQKFFYCNINITIERSITLFSHNTTLSVTQFCMNQICCFTRKRLLVAFAFVLIWTAFGWRNVTTIG